MLCIGHRGAMGYKPENTLASFALALEMGCPWVELDVHLCDGEIVVIHDDSLDRTTNGKGRLASKRFPEIRSLDAGEGEKIPTLREVIDLVSGRAGINVELKGPGTAVAVSELLNGYCNEGARPADFLISSFDHKELARSDPRFQRGVLIGKRFRGNCFDVTTLLDAWSLNLDLEIVKAGTVDEAHRRGLKVFVYTVNAAKDIQRMRDLGVDGVFTNFPDRVLQAS